MGNPEDRFFSCQGPYDNKFKKKKIKSAYVLNDIVLES